MDDYELAVVKMDDVSFLRTAFYDAGADSVCGAPPHSFSLPGHINEFPYPAHRIARRKAMAAPKI